jgi:hypothetical protein
VPFKQPEPQRYSILLADGLGFFSAVTARTPVGESAHPVRHCPASGAVFLDGLSLVNFGHLSFVDRVGFLSATALTLENIGLHRCSNSLVKLQEYCAESCGGVKVEGAESGDGLKG